MYSYNDFVVSQTPRLLSQLDRNKNSKTFGSFDRNYWNYKIRDFSSIVLQQGSLALSLLYSHDFPGNDYFQNGKIREWTIGSLNFWSESQLSDGSFNEYWPYEHGYPPTVFSLFSAAESYKLLSDFIEEPIKDNLLESIKKSCKFISKKLEFGAQNQEIASIAALYSSYQVINDKKILDVIDKKIKTISELQNKEGWFSEYGGADIGYMSVSLYFLSEYYRLSEDNQVLPLIENSLNFLQFFIHPDSTVGGEYGSRNTEYFLPGGLENVADIFPIAGLIADKLFQSKFSNLPWSVDDRYLSHYFLHSYIRALLNNRSRHYSGSLPCEHDSLNKYYHDSGLFIKKQGKMFTIVSTKKGVIKVFFEDSEILNDCGYIAKVNDKIYATNWLDALNKIKVNNDSIEINSKFHATPSGNHFNPFNHCALRVLSFISGEKMIPILKSRLINLDKTTPVEFKRTVKFSTDDLTILDSVSSPFTLDSVNPVDSFSFRYVPSSNYFQINEIKRLPFIDTFHSINNLQIEKKINCNTGRINEKIVKME